MTIFQLSQELIFPNPELAEPEGLLAVGGDLTVDRLLLAYSMGIFPWYSDSQPILWWSPDPRSILVPNQLHISKSLKRVIQRDRFEIRFDTKFAEVIERCGEIKRKDQNGTWITNEMQAAYIQLHLAGFAHSVECFVKNDLVGGLYGVSIGKAFFGESMFSLKTDASKVALASLANQLEKWDFEMIDCQIPTDHLKRMGAFEIDRPSFLKKLNTLITEPSQIGNWGNMVTPGSLIS